MDIFEYLPQLIVAYDSSDEFANLIHVKKAGKDNNYYCPCCGGIVRPLALNSNKEQSHYYHITGRCTKESQLHFFCKNWLFESGSKFYINENLYEVDHIDIEKTWNTPFGKYRPDITVYTVSGKIIFFEMFFSNRKTGDDYFCKWDSLRNDVVEVNVKEYMFKTNKNIIPAFIYMYHDGNCYSKSYKRKDLYIDTIAKIKQKLSRQKLLNYKARIEKLDWFWAQVQNGDRNAILKSVSDMEYEDMISCYEIIKRKHCVSYLKENVLNIINQKVISVIRNSLDVPCSEEVYFDLEKKYGRTYECGIRLKFCTDHIVYDKLCFHCKYNGRDFDKCYGYPKIVFKKIILSPEEIKIPRNKIPELNDIFNRTIEYKKQLIEYEKELSKLEDKGYKVRFNNNHYTVLKKLENNKFEPLLKNQYIGGLDIDLLSQKIQHELNDKAEKDFLENYIKGREVQELISGYYSQPIFLARQIKRVDSDCFPAIFYRLIFYANYCVNISSTVYGFPSQRRCSAWISFMLFLRHVSI